MKKRGVKEKVLGFLKSNKKKEKEEILDKLKIMANTGEKAISKKNPLKIKDPKKKLIINKEKTKGKIPKQKLIKKKLSKKKFPLKFDKHPENPIISPNSRNGWESWQTFNPGAVLIDDKVHFLYRAIGHDGISRLGYANSNDGLKINERHPEPAYQHVFSASKVPSFNIYSYASGGGWGGGCEDARISYIEEDGRIYIIYTACDNGLRIGLSSIKVEDFLKKDWKWKNSKLISKPGELHKNWMLFPEKIKGKYAILHSIVPKLEVEYLDNLNFDEIEYVDSSRKFGPQKNESSKKTWDKWLRGPGATPVKTKEGWLLFYHGMDKDWSKYKVGVMLLDLKDPTKILYRSKEPVLEPEEFYENNGFKAGIVYVSGAVIKDGELLVYYGGSDSFVCVASANLDKFLQALKKGIKPKLKKKKIKQRK